MSSSSGGQLRCSVCGERAEFTVYEADPADPEKRRIVAYCDADDPESSPAPSPTAP